MIKLEYSLNLELLQSRLQDIEASLQRLKELRKEFSSKKQFMQDRDAYGICEHHLRRSLEALLSCGSHILSRIPGAKFDDYAAIAAKLVEYEVLPVEFRQKAIKMAKYRNRLVHFYHEVSKEELFEILKHYLSDVENFHTHLLRFVKDQTRKQD